MSTEPPKQQALASLLSEEEMWCSYLTGLERNIHSKLAGLFGVSSGAQDTHKIRGTRDNGILLYALRFDSLRSLIGKLADPGRNGVKQGKASLHDLALAFTFVEAGLKQVGIENSRPESTFASSALLGDLIPLLRQALHRLHDQFPSKEFGELSESELRDSLGGMGGQIENGLAIAIGREGKAQRLKQICGALTLRESLRIFNQLERSGLDQRDFNDFLSSGWIDRETHKEDYHS